MFTHIARCAKHVPHKAARNGWNSKWAGRAAFTTLRSDGYLCGSVLGLNLLAHRAAWAVFYGVWPSQNIDHLNGIKSDNRIENLRDVCQQENLRNAKLSDRNTARRIGIGWCSRRHKWRARIKTNWTDKHLGYFDDLEQAIEARALAEKEMGFHPNHGRAKG